MGEGAEPAENGMSGTYVWYMHLMHSSAAWLTMWLPLSLLFRFCSSNRDADVCSCRQVASTWDTECVVRQRWERREVMYCFLFWCTAPRVKDGSSEVILPVGPNHGYQSVCMFSWGADQKLLVKHPSSIKRPTLTVGTRTRYRHPRMIFSGY